MFRLSRFLEALRDNPPVAPARKPPGPVVIWNLIRRFREIWADRSDPPTIIAKQSGKFHGTFKN